MSTRILTAGDYGIRPWSGFFLNGTSRDLNVDASSAEQLFKISAVENKFLHVQCVKFKMLSKKLNVDSSDIDIFGVAGALTNGIGMYTDQQGTQGTIFSDTVKSLGDLLLYSENIDNLVNCKSGGRDLVIAKIPFWAPVTLINGAQGDELIISVHDDLSGFDSFTVVAYGFTEDK